MIYSYVKACKEGDLSKIRNHIKRRNQPDASQNRPIRLAAEYGHVHVFNYFFDSFPQISEDRKAMEIALTLAAKNGHIDIVKRICQTLNVSVIQAFQNACKNGQLDVAKYLFKNFTSQFEPDIESIFSTVGQSGDVELACMMLDKHNLLADAQLFNKHINLLFKDACVHGNLQLIDFLIVMYTQNLDVSDERILKDVIHHGQHQTLSKLLSLPYYQEVEDSVMTQLLKSSIWTASKAGHAKVVEVLLKKFKTWDTYDLQVIFDRAVLNHSHPLLHLLLSSYSTTFDIPRDYYCKLESLRYVKEPRLHIETLSILTYYRPSLMNAITGDKSLSQYSRDLIQQLINSRHIAFGEVLNKKGIPELLALMISEYVIGYQSVNTIMTAYDMSRAKKRPLNECNEACIQSELGFDSQENDEPHDSHSFFETDNKYMGTLL